MLTTPLLHPPTLHALAAAGHGSKVLITDSNYPASTTLGPNAELVHLNWRPGVLSATEVLEGLLAVVPVEAAAVMAYATEGPYAMSEDPDIWADFTTLLGRAGGPTELQRIERFAFYDAVDDPSVALVIHCGEQRIYANILLTIGVVKPA